MKYVFIDTSVFETNNFFESARINQLLKLSEEEELRIVLTKITYYELISRFRKNFKISYEGFKAFRDKGRALRNLPSKKEIFSTIDENENVKEFTQILDNKLAQAKCLTLDYPTLNIEEVFTKYFVKQNPFGDGQKKDEFPDAFALATLEKWCEEEGHKCHVLSIDKDMLGYTSPYLIVSPDYEIFLDEILRDIQKNKESIDAAIKYFALHQDEAVAAVQEWLEKSLYDDVAIYRELANSMEVYTVNIEEQSIELDAPQLISTSSRSIEVETLADVYFKVGIEIDDEEYSHYDEEDKSFIYPYQVLRTIKRTESIPVIVRIDMNTNERHIGILGLKVIKINDGKPLKIERYQHK